MSASAPARPNCGFASAVLRSITATGRIASPPALGWPVIRSRGVSSACGVGSAVGSGAASGSEAGVLTGTALPGAPPKAQPAKRAAAQTSAKIRFILSLPCGARP